MSVVARRRFFGWIGAVTMHGLLLKIPPFAAAASQANQTQPSKDAEAPEWLHGTWTFSKLTTMRAANTTTATAEGSLELQSTGTYVWKFRVSNSKQPTTLTEFKGKYRVRQNAVSFMMKGADGVEEATIYKYEREHKTSGGLILTRDYPDGGQDIYVLQPAGSPQKAPSP